jgi:hypothetical protein
MIFVQNVPHGRDSWKPEPWSASRSVDCWIRRWPSGVALAAMRRRARPAAAQLHRRQRSAVAGLWRRASARSRVAFKHRRDPCGLPKKTSRYQRMRRVHVGVAGPFGAAAASVVAGSSFPRPRSRVPLATTRTRGAMRVSLVDALGGPHWSTTSRTECSV